MTRLGCVSRKLRLDLFLKILGVMTGLAIMASVITVLPADAEGLSGPSDGKDLGMGGAVKLVRVDGQTVRERPAEITFFTDHSGALADTATQVKMETPERHTQAGPVGPGQTADMYFMEPAEHGPPDLGADSGGKTTEKSYFQDARPIQGPSDKPDFPAKEESEIDAEKESEADVEKGAEELETKSKAANRPRKLPVDETKVTATPLNPDLGPSAGELSPPPAKAAQTNTSPGELPGASLISDKLGHTLSSKPETPPQARPAVHVDRSADTLSPPPEDSASVLRAGTLKEPPKTLENSPSEASPSHQGGATEQPEKGPEGTKAAEVTLDRSNTPSPLHINVPPTASHLGARADSASDSRPGQAYVNDTVVLLQQAEPPSIEGASPVVTITDDDAQANQPPLEPQEDPLVDNDPARAFRIDELGPFEVIDHSDELTVIKRRSKLLRTKVDVYRTSVVDPNVCDVIQFTPREISVIGHNEGATHVTFWFEGGNHRPVTYLVNVIRDPEVKERREEAYALMEEHLAELFPNSRVRLIALADKLIVKGQARDAEEAAQILALIRGQMVRPGYHVFGGHTNSDLPAAQVINMLQIPGVHQVALKVKIAQMSRSAARNFGVPLDMTLDWKDGAIFIQHLIGAATGANSSGSILGSFDSDDIAFGIQYLEQHGVVRVLSEPTLVTMSGKAANFHAGGEIAVPTAVSVGGIGAVTTDFRAIGANISFLPVVLDKDHIRLHVSPSFSSANNGSDASGGLTSRSVNTTVEMREGQTLAIAGLLDESIKGDTQSNLPFVAQLFGQRGATHNESELIILVTPELMHPMEPEEVPPLPGFDITEPDNFEFFLKGHIEGKPPYEYRSTVWPRLFRRYKAGGPAMISGPFGHAD